MSDVFDEISDDLRREQLKAFWRENGSWVIGGVIAAIVLTGVMSFWRQWDYKRNAAATSQLVQLEMAADLGKLESFATEADRKHAMAARFSAAGTYLARGEKDKAIALYNQIAGMFGVDKTYRALAKLLSIAQRVDSGDPVKLEAELAALENSPWHYTVSELQALLQHKQGRSDKAIELLTAIAADPDAPTEARARALNLRDLYTAGVE